MLYLASVSTPLGSRRNPSYTRRLVMLGLAIPMLSCFAVGMIQWREARDFHESSRWLAHTHIVQKNLNEALSCVKDAEIGQKGFLLTHRKEYLEPYHKALANTRSQIQKLRRLTADNSVQQKNLDLLEPLVEAKLAVIEKTVVSGHAGQFDEALRIINTDHGKMIMDQIRSLFDTMQVEENRLLEIRENDFNDHAAAYFRIALWILLLGTGFTLSLILLLRRLEQLNSLVTICAWSKMIQYKDEWMSVEEYLQRRFNVQVTHGISEEEAEKVLKELESQKTEAKR